MAFHFSFISIFFSFILFGSAQPKKTEPNKNEAQLAFQYLSEVRTKPSLFYAEFPFLKSAKISKQILRWNDTLARVAEAKAMDMAQKNYFSHTNKEGKGINILIHQAGYALPTDWIKPKSNNFFESIAAGKENAVESIKLLLVDKGVPSLGHRKHLLGSDSFYGELTDVGIGFVKGNEKSDYTSYLCIIIAKQK